MNAQQLYDEALKHINGTGGYPKNPKRGEKMMLEASNAGSRQAAGYYAMHYAKKDSDKLIHFQKSGAGADYPTEYVRCLLTTAQKEAKKNPNIAKSNYSVAKDVKVHDDGYYYLAELAKLAGESDQTYRDYLYLAALGMSKAMPESAYKYIGRDYGVIYDKEEINLWIKANNIETYFVDIKKTEEEAWRIVEANLSTKEGKAKLASGGASAMLKKRPLGTLEYQRVINVSYRTEVISAGVEYNNPNYSSVMTGTISNFNVNESNPTRANWYPDFRFRDKHTIAWQTFKPLSYSSAVPSKGRFRVGTPYYNAIINECFTYTEKISKDHALYRLKEHLNQTKNWEISYIKTNLKQTDTKLSQFNILFVPFYFFTVELALGKTATARVNAQTGDIDFFDNCPYGQFDEYDKYLIGGNARMTAEQIKSLQKSANRASSEKDKKIAKFLAIGGAATFVLSLVLQNSMNELAAILFLLTPCLLVGALIMAFKPFFKSLIGKFKK
ncbi:MAG: hypothetical protein IJ996_02010 [Clostridia bacterium]|nr:hypothetical protein [Clostridia bacterium]